MNQPRYTVKLTFNYDFYNNSPPIVEDCVTIECARRIFNQLSSMVDNTVQSLTITDNINGVIIKRFNGH